MSATGDYNKNVCNCSCLSAGLVKVMCAIYQDIWNKKDSLCYVYVVSVTIMDT